MSAARSVLLPLQAVLPGLAVGGLMWPYGTGEAIRLGLFTCLVAGALALAADRVWRRASERQASAIRALSEHRRSLVHRELPPALEDVVREVALLDARWNDRCEALTRQSETLLAALDSMAEGVWITDREGTLLRSNRALKEMLFSTQPVTGERPLALLRSEALHTAVMRACKDGQSAQLELQVEGLRPRNLDIRVTPLGGDLPGSAAVFRDVTELRRLEKVRKDFVANVSHELRTPITAIRGYAETLQSGALADREMAPRMVDVIHRQSERLSELVEDLLELSRLESKELKLASEQVDMAQAAQRAAETVRVKAINKRLTLAVEVPPSLEVLGDRRAVEQVLLNLLDNAVKYTPDGGRVVLTAWVEVGRAVVAVKDSGIGIEGRHLSRIFERFYRVDKGRSRDMGGTGLGLSIVKHLLGGMEGDVQVESTPNVGSTFTVFLPLAAATASAAG
ncbi:MAG: ATP-binding protein [Myxococcaceae bacterium]|nr:ATP-binding protein [Myxococcaceae bacterium]MCI0672984.1 ATP-binding protein [Myxococcaceae bacterium]